jgi:hypothetical protein
LQSLGNPIERFPYPLPKGRQTPLNGVAKRAEIVCFWQRFESVTRGKIFAGELSY